jgi:uncharacterized protein (TIGR02266 family)
MDASESRMTEQTERRAYPRVPFAAKVDAEAESRSFLAVACDISAGGMKIFTGNPVAAGQTVLLTFALPGMAAPICVRGVVRHLMVGQGMGVEFVDLSAEALAAIRAYVSGSS